MEKNKLVFSFAKLEDADDIERIAKDSFTDPWTKKGFEEAIEDENAFVIVVKDIEELVAYAVLYQGADEAELVSIAVDKSHRGLGIGKVLMGKILYQARERGVSKIYLEVRASNQSAIALYESFGFVKDGVRKAFYRDNNEDANVMHLEILS